jgi:hypothetical protein
VCGSLRIIDVVPLRNGSLKRVRKKADPHEWQLMVAKNPDEARQIQIPPDTQIAVVWLF